LVKGISGGDANQDRYTDIYYSGRGTLPKTPSWECDYYTYCMYSFLLDADGDALLDLIQSDIRGIIGYFRKGGTLLRRPSWVYSAGEPYVISDIRVGDVNADGYPDVAAGCSCYAGNPTGGPNKLFLNKANIGITVRGFAAFASARGAALRWEVDEAVAGFNLYREVGNAEAASEPGKINAELITGRSPYRYLDAAVEAGKTYRYWVEVVPLGGAAERHGPVVCTVGAKASFALAQNRPNPASTSTTVAFAVPAACEAALTFFDVAGRKVATHTFRAKRGANEVALDISSLTPGVYTYRLEAGGEVTARRMVVTK
jgi:hypothetical protein